MARFSIACLLLVAAAGFSADDTIVLVNELYEDQQAERIVVLIDDKPVAELATSKKKRSVRKEIKVPPGRHTLRIEGEITMDGEQLALHGGGVIEKEATLYQAFDQADSAHQVADVFLAAMSAIHSSFKGFEKSGMLEPDYEGYFQITRSDPATDQGLAAAEKRLGIELPADYRQAMRQLGGFRIGDEEDFTGILFHPGEVVTVAEYLADQFGESPEEAAQYLEQIRKLHPKYAGDVVLGAFLLDEPLILRPRRSCPKGKAAYAFPGSDIDLLANQMGIELVDTSLKAAAYESLEETTECLSFREALVEMLWLHLADMLEHFYFLWTPGETYTFYQYTVDWDNHTVWLYLR
jgi:hypothetical protein